MLARTKSDNKLSFMFKGEQQGVITEEDKQKKKKNWHYRQAKDYQPVYPISFKSQG